MDNNLAVVYLSVLLALLSGVSFTILRQVFKTRKTEGTLAQLQKKLSKEKGTSEEYYQLGSIYLDKKLYSQAISTLQKGLKDADKEQPENVALIYNCLGYAAFAQEQYDLAIRQYKEALKRDPNSITVLNNLGHAYEKKSLTAQALQTYEQVLQSDPNNTTAKRRAESLRKRVVSSA